MFIKNNFKTIDLNDEGLVISLNSKSNKNIIFSEIKQIYITKYDFPIFYIILFFLISVLVFGYIIYQNLNLYYIIPLVIIIAFFIHLIDRIQYMLIVSLKDGSTFKKIYPYKLKTQTSDFVYKVRDAIFKNNIKLNNNI